MTTFPHRYGVVAEGSPGDVEVDLHSNGLSPIDTALPAEFGGPGDRWSPETLLVGAVADCFLLTFRGVARAQALPWIAARCEVTGTLDRVGGILQFVDFVIRATVHVPQGTPEEAARRVLERAERGCLITNSLKGLHHVEALVHVTPAVEFV